MACSTELFGDARLTFGTRGQDAKRHHTKWRVSSHRSLYKCIVRGFYTPRSLSCERPKNAFTQMAPSAMHDLSCGKAEVSLMAVNGIRDTAD